MDKTIMLVTILMASLIAPSIAFASSLDSLYSYYIDNGESIQEIIPVLDPYFIEFISEDGLMKSVPQKNPVVASIETTEEIPDEVPYIT